MFSIKMRLPMKTQEEINKLLEESNNGNASSQNSLACAYYTGDGVVKNIPEAMRLFELECAGGDKYGQYNIANSYKYGRDGYSRDYKKAFELFLKSANQGYADAQESLAYCYDLGQGTARDYIKAAEWFTKAAQKGKFVSQNSIALKYQKGEGVKQNSRYALNWFHRSASSNYKYASYNLGVAYEQGKGTPVNYAKAKYWYEKAIEQGHPSAKDNLSSLLDRVDIDLLPYAYSCNLIYDNPFRILGLYSNATLREINANKSKISVFEKIGKHIDFETDKLMECFYHPVHPICDKNIDSSHSNQSLEELYKTIRLKEKALNKRLDEIKASDTDIQVLTPEVKELLLLGTEYEVKRKEKFLGMRTASNIDDAIRHLSQPSDRLKFSFFWFVTVTESDSTAVNYVINKEFDKAQEIWEERDDLSALINRAILGFYYADEYDIWVSNFTKIIHDETLRTEYLKLVCDDTFSMSEDELSHLFIDTIISNFSDEDWKKIFYDNGVSGDDDDYICSVIGKFYIDDIATKINQLSNISREKGQERFTIASSLKKTLENQLGYIEYVIGDEDYEYQNICDKAGRELFNAAIDYYKDCGEIDYDVTKKCLDLNQYALDISYGSILRQRISDSLEQIQELYDNLPPRSVYPSYKSINEKIDEYDELQHTVRNASNLLKACVPFLRTIKEEVGINGKSYISICTKLTEKVLSFMIEEFNLESDKLNKLAESVKDSSSSSGLSFARMAISTSVSSMKDLMKSSWQLFLNCERLSLSKEFKEERFIPNKNVIANHLREFHVNTTSMFSNIDLRTETDVYNSCRRLSDYKNYLTTFPKGKYRTLAQNKINELSAIDNRYWEECLQNRNYSGYISKYPYGLHTIEAKREIEKIRAAEDNNYWTACQSMLSNNQSRQILYSD